MLNLSKAKSAKMFEIHLNPVMLVFIYRAFAEYCQMSTNMPRFEFFSFFIIVVDQINLQQQKG